MNSLRFSKTLMLTFLTMTLLTGCLGIGNQSNDVAVIKPPFPKPAPCVGPAIQMAHMELISEACKDDVRSWLADLGRLKMKLEN